MPRSRIAASAGCASRIVADRDAYLKSLYALTGHDFDFDETTLPPAPDNGPTLGNLIEELRGAGSER